MDNVIAYVDGAYSSNTDIVGAGVVIVDQYDNVIDTIQATVTKEYAKIMNNVAGELKATILAVKYGIVHNAKTIVIKYDYEGIEKWINGEWKCNKQATKEYRQWILNHKNKINIIFEKIKRSDNAADIIAKKSAGI